VACKEHRTLAKEVAQKAIVLLKNDSKLLPLDRAACKKVVLLGDLAMKANIGDLGSSRVYPPYVITPFDGIKKSAGNLIDVKVISHKNLTSLSPTDQDAIKTADGVIIVVGFSFKDEGENILVNGGDRSSLTLKAKDEMLILQASELNSKCIVVLEGGSAIITENWREKVPAILMTWYPGMEGGSALGEILFGDVNPNGKLPISFPRSTDQLPFFDKSAKEITYEYLHGYRFMEKNQYEPAFAFGFGLSYTTFSYQNLQLQSNELKSSDLLKLSVEITNNGKRSGEEICQVYIGKLSSSIERPIKELKAFQKITILPNENKMINFELSLQKLAYYDGITAKWVIELGEYQLFVGGSSRSQDLLSLNFSISS
jgi:beta-glucosidase